MCAQAGDIYFLGGYKLGPRFMVAICRVQTGFFMAFATTSKVALTGFVWGSLAPAASATSPVRSDPGGSRLHDPFPGRLSSRTLFVVLLHKGFCTTRERALRFSKG